ncbi:hypothetical protein D9M73_223370 [compost metagenome]
MLGELPQQLAAVAPMVPIQGHIDRPMGRNLDQATGLELFSHLQFRHQAPTQARFGQANEAFGRRAQLVFEPAFDAQRRQVAVLQEIVRAEHQCWHPCQLGGIEPVREMSRNELWAGQGPITHGAE